MKNNRTSWARKLLPVELGRTLRRNSSMTGLMFALSLLLMAAAAWYVASPTRLTIALPPGEEASAMRVFARLLNEQSTGIVLDPLEVADFHQSAEALEQRKAVLAVVQPDILYPANGGTIAIFRQEAVVIVRSGDEEQGPRQLAGKNIGMLTARPTDAKVLTRILSHYDLAPPATTVTWMDPREIESSSRSDRMDAIVLLATPGAEDTRRMMSLAEKLLGEQISILPLDGAEILVRTLPDLSEMTLPAHALGKLPKEEAKTVAISYRLVAANTLDRALVFRLTEHLFQMRAQIARSEPSINFMEAPDDGTSLTAKLPNHRGAVDYLNREQVTFMTRYGDWIWLGLFAGGGVTSLFGWLAQALARKRREAIDSVLDRLLRILSEARRCNSLSALDELAVEIDGLVARAVRLARKQTTSVRTMGSLMVALDGARGAVADRRRDLVAENAAASASGAKAVEGAPSGD